MTPPPAPVYDTLDDRLWDATLAAVVARCLADSKRDATEARREAERLFEELEVQSER
jgi:hypothetical protein